MSKFNALAYGDKFNTITFGDRCSDEFEIYCDVETLSMLPTQRTYQMDIAGLDGSVDFGIGGYEKRNLQKKLYYFGDYRDLRANREKLMAWLSSCKGEYKKLYLGTDTKYYKAKVVSAFDVEITSNREIACVNFECNPPWQYDGEILQTPEQILWNNQDRVEGNQWFKKFTKSGNFRITNDGSPVKPKIKIMGNVHSGTELVLSPELQLGAKRICFKDDISNANICIDCENETITNGNINIYDKLVEDWKDYFELPSGKVDIEVSSSFLGEYPECLYIIIEFDKIVGVS